MTPSLDSSAVWLVTGCSTGLGRSIAAHVFKSDHTIVATARNVNSLSYLPDSPKVLRLALDVTSKENIDSVIEATVTRYGRIDVVINNAGYGSMGELESFSEEDSRLQMETNFWGPVNVTKAALRVFREVNAPGQGGTIVQVSSIGGQITFPGNAIYHASKFALEGFSKSLAKEVIPEWNIKVLIISLGGTNTDFAANLKIIPRHPAYSSNPNAPLTQLLQWLSDPDLSKSWASPDSCAAVIFNAIIDKEERPMPVRFNFGADALALARNDANAVLKELGEWEKETCSVTPSNI